MSKRKSRPRTLPASEPRPEPRRRGWLGLAVGSVACLVAVVYVTAEGLGVRRPGGGGEREAIATPADGSGLTASNPGDSVPARAPDPAQVAALASMTGKELPADVQMLLDGTAPKHLQYDAAKNQHWWAPHNHWHPGPPPAATPAAVPFDPNAPAVMPDGSPAVPWEYDAVNNRYWHPGHGHWHQGPPPPEGQRE